MENFLVKFFSDRSHSEASLIAETIASGNTAAEALTKAREALKHRHPEVATCIDTSATSHKRERG
jgi:hypothetical protein